ncbi:MAG: hypothetical protein ACREXR_06975 [Gammaproteobacteria bacterium]
MLTRLFFLGVLSALPASALSAQEAMEMFIPIGDSHGVSNIYSNIGKIATVNEQNRSLTMSDSSGVRYLVTIPNEVPIWLDRSKGQGKNQVGSLADLQPGRTVEVKYKEAPTRGTSVTADWVKVEMTN